MRRRKIGLGGGSGNGALTDRTLIVSGVATGIIANVSKYLPGATWSKISGLTNVSIAANGDANASVAVGVGSTAPGVVSGVLGSRRVDFAVTLQGVAVAPAAPSIGITPGNGQLSIAWTDGATGGTAITAHKLYRSTTSGFSPGPGTLVGTITGGSPYIDSGLSNGTAYYYRLSAVNNAGEGAASGEQSGVPSLSVILYRTMDYVFYGSSTYGNTGNGSPTDGRTNAVPGASIGMTLQGRLAAVIPTQTGKICTNITVPQYVGNPNSSTEDIRRKAIADIGTGFINAGKGVFFGSPNMWVSTATETPPNLPETTRDTVNQLKATMEQLDAVGCPRFLMWTFAIYGPNAMLYYSQWVRLQKIAKARGPRLKSGFSCLDEAAFRQLPSQAVQDDINSQAARYRPLAFTNGLDAAHSNGEGYRIYGDYFALPAKTWEGGLPFISPFHYHSYLTGPGRIATLITMGELAGCTFSVDDPTFSLSLADNPSYPGPDQPQKVLDLYLVGARPIKAPHELQITVSKPGYGSEVFRISTAIQRRDPSDQKPQKVVLKQSAVWFSGYSDTLGQQFFANTRKFTMFLMVKINPFDGQQLQFNEAAGAGVGYMTCNPPAGTSDNYGTIYFMSIEKQAGIRTFALRRTGVNQLNLVVQDGTGSTNAINVTTSVNSLMSYHGWRMISIHYDADQPTKCKLRLSGGRRTDTGVNYASETVPITPGGDGTLGLGLSQTPSQRSMLRFFQDSEYMPTMFFPCSVWRCSMATDFIEDTAPNLAAIWTEANSVGPVAADAPALVGGGSTLDGVTFLLDLRGDAAEWCSGADDIDYMDEESGGKKCRNFGVGPCLHVTTPRAIEFEAAG